MSVISYKGKTPEIHKSTFIAHDANVIGDVVIGADCGIWFGVTIRGDVHEIRIGNRTNIQDGSVIHVTENYAGTYIGDDVTIGHMALIHACTIGNGAFIGMKSCIMDKAVVEDGAMVAAGALVTPGKVVPSGQLWAGSPARFMRHLSDEDVKHIKDSATHYARLAGDYL